MSFNTLLVIDFAHCTPARVDELSREETVSAIDVLRKVAPNPTSMRDCIHYHAAMARLETHLNTKRDDPRAKEIYDKIKHVQTGAHDMLGAGIMWDIKEKLARMSGEDLEALEVVLKHEGPERTVRILSQ